MARWLVINLITVLLVPFLLLLTVWQIVVSLLAHPRSVPGLEAIDEWANALMGGNRQETISSRAFKAQLRGKQWGCILCKLLDYVDKGHCAKSVDNNVPE